MQEKTRVRVYTVQLWTTEGDGLLILPSQYLFRTDQNVKVSIKKKEIQKVSNRQVAILNTAVVAHYLQIRLKGLLILQSARRPVGREKVLYT